MQLTRGCGILFSTTSKSQEPSAMPIRVFLERHGLEDTETITVFDGVMNVCRVS